MSDNAANPQGADHSRLAFLEEVPHSLEVEIARKDIPLKEVVSWKKDTVVEFEKSVGKSAEVLIGDQLVARGEVVVVNGRYGIRISEITHPSEKPGSRSRK